MFRGFVKGYRRLIEKHSTSAGCRRLFPYLLPLAFYFLRPPPRHSRTLASGIRFRSLLYPLAAVPRRPRSSVMEHQDAAIRKLLDEMRLMEAGLSDGISSDSTTENLLSPRDESSRLVASSRAFLGLQH
jgi:hypothetical protein